MPVGMGEKQPAPGEERRKRRTPDPDEPKRPDKEAMIAKTTELRNKANELKEKIKELQEEQEQLKNSEERTKQQAARRDLINKKKSLLNETQALREKLNKLHGESRKDREVMFEQQKELRMLKKEVGDNVTPEAIEKQIRELEFKIESGGCNNIKGEKRLMQEIKSLKEKKVRVEAVFAKLATMNLATPTADGESLTKDDEIAKTKAQIDAKRLEIETVIGELDDLDKQRQGGAQQDKFAELREKRTELNSQIDKLWDQIRERQKKFDQDMDEWREKLAEYKKKKEQEWEERRRKKAEEDAKYEAKRREEELERQSIHRRNPHKNEIDMCETLMALLRGQAALQPREPKAEKKTNFDAEAAVDGKKFAGKQLAVLKKDEDDSLFFGKKKKDTKKDTKKEAPKPKAEAAPLPTKRKPLRISSEKFETFEKLGVQVPLYTDQVKEALEELRKKKEHFESFKLSDKEAMALEQAERKKREAEAAAAAAPADEE